MKQAAAYLLWLFILFLLPSLSLADDFRQRLSSELVSGDYTVEDIQAEIYFGRELASKVLGRHPVWNNPEVNQYLNKVGQLLVQNTLRPELTYRFIALDTDEINAFAAPGGYIFITRGALELVENEAELAGILGHEIGHIEHRHYVKAVGLRATHGDFESGLTTMLMGGGAAAAAAFDQAVNEMMAIFFETGLQSHEDEFEADQTAVWLLALAGYHPGALKEFFIRRQASLNDEGDGMSLTHPSYSERIQRMEIQLIESGLNQLKQAKMEERFNEYFK